MTAIKPNPLFRLMPSMTDVAFALPLVFLFTRLEGVRTMLGDGDTGWHIRTGEWILAHHAVPRVDIFSYTRAGEPWFAWEWLWDAGAAWLHQHWGLGGVVLASMLVLCVTFMLLYRLVERRTGNALVAILITALAASGSAIHWLARPHLFTWLFIVIFLAVLERVREGRTRVLLWLPFLTILWTNLHGGFLAGIVIVGAYAGGELVRALVAVKSSERNAALRAAVPYTVTTGACLAASLLNPYFYHLHAHIVSYLQDPYEIKHIVEFQSANFRNAGAGFFESMMVLALAAAPWSASRRNFGDALLVAGWGHLGLLSARNIPLFMIVAAPLVAEAVVQWARTAADAGLPGWLRKFAQSIGSIGDEIAPFERIGRVHAVCAMMLTAVGLGIASSGAGKFLKPEYDPKAYPSKALALLQEPGQRLFADDEWGDYLIYNLAPKGIKVYIDGRSDFYGPKFCEEYIQLLGVKYDWEQTLARYGVNTVLLPPDAPLASTIKESSRWRVVYDDGSAIVFRAVPPRAEQLSTEVRSGTGRGLTITQSYQSKGATP
jgi:hypothetical protein